MNTLTIGPFFTEHHPSASENPRVVPLGFQLEWATTKEVAAIPLFRHLPRHGPNRVRLEHLVFASAQLPFDIECSEYPVIETPLGTYLPLEALLSGLYSRFEISRSIFVVLAELTELVSLSGCVRRPIGISGLLIPEAEQKGFLLNSVFRESERIFAEIGWQHPLQEYVFHTCLCGFSSKRIERGEPGIWTAAGVIGVNQPLSRELRNIAPGSPSSLFTPLGQSFLKSHSSTHPARALRAKSRPNKKVV
jgi:hypothetical protein